MRYRADITAGSLKVADSRIIADLLLRSLDATEWQQAIVEQNVLQVRTAETAKRFARLIRGRLETMEADLWRLVRDGAGEVATHAVLAAAIKHSRLLGDFLDLVVREHYRIFSETLSSKSWQDYLDECRGRDPEMPVWNESTQKRLRSTVFQILAQAGYIDNTRTRRLQTVHIASQVLQYLEGHHEHYVLRCIQVSP
jgi:hypothetical protein